MDDEMMVIELNQVRFISATCRHPSIIRGSSSIKKKKKGRTGTAIGHATNDICYKWQPCKLQLWNE